jgi:DNA-directed RNA polymerase subunit beta'
MGNLLDLTLRDLEKVVYYSNYVIIDAGEQTEVPDYSGNAPDVLKPIEQNMLIGEEEYLWLKLNAKEQGDTAFYADIGAPAARELLKRLDVDKTSEELRAAVAVETSQHKKKALLKRLKVVDAFRNSGDHSGQRNKPEWMILDVVP